MVMFEAMVSIMINIWSRHLRQQKPAA